MSHFCELERWRRRYASPCSGFFRTCLATAFVTLCFSPAPAPAQESGVAAGANQIADFAALQSFRRIVVVDFAGPDGRTTQLGRQLAQDIRVELARQARGAEVLSPSNFKKLFDEFDLPESDSFVPAVMLFCGQSLGADAIVTASLRRGDAALSAHLEVRRIPAGSPDARDYYPRDKALFSAQFDVPLTPDRQALLQQIVGDTARDVRSFREDDPDFVRPRCGHCPDPHYTREAREFKLEGKLLIAATITADGRVEELRLLRKLGRGLDQQSLREVSGWRLEPGRLASGQPVATRLLIEVTFRLLR
jgi:hypothetical protein